MYGSHRASAVAVVAEYDPLHRGHAYHISRSRILAKADAVIAIISSNMTQRGGPAMFAKHARARMALASGVDLVLELPVVFSCASAGTFASAAVDSLAATGAVRALSFGMETPGCDLMRLAEILAHEPAEFRSALHDALAEGWSFAQAQSIALASLVPGADVLSRGPNDMLAASYVARIIARSYEIEPIAIERVGDPYSSKTPISSIASASAIRELIRSGRTEDALALMPPACAQIASEELSAGRAVVDDDGQLRLLRALVARARDDELADTAESSEGFENRAARAVQRAESWDDLVESCATRRYTRARVRRWASMLMLGVSAEDNRRFRDRGPAYLRVLGANERGREILRAMRASSALPIVSRASAPFDRYASSMMDIEHTATEIRELMTPHPRTRAEAVTAPVMI